MIEYKEIDAASVKKYKRGLLKHYLNIKELTKAMLELMKPYEGKKITKRIETMLRKELIGKFNIETMTPWRDEKKAYAGIYLNNEYSWWDIKVHFTYDDFDGNKETMSFNIGFTEDYFEDSDKNMLKTVSVNVLNWIAECEMVIADVNAASKKWNKAVKAMDDLMKHGKCLDRVPSRFYKMRG